MSVIKVTAAELDSTASQLQSLYSTISEASQSALNAVNTLTAEGWQGGGSAAAQAAITQWQAGATQIQEALNTLSMLITKASGTYTESDSSVASSFA
ncbi:MAG: WXG100 family type VII secretion target [Solirubrobacteraceae bacterium]